MKTILIAVSGSIAFYKAYELLSFFKKENFRVKVLLSNGVLKFASKMSFEALADEVLCEENESWFNTKNHIAFTKDVDVVLFAPATINSINKLALGISDTLFIQTLIASKAPLLVAPAANTTMFFHFSTQNSLHLLEKNGAIVIPPISKILACKDEGVGAMAEISSIVSLVKRKLLKEDFWSNKTIVVTGGPTREKIDDVRCLTNFSSGKMAKAIADAFYYLGAKTIFLSSVFFNTPYELYSFQDSKELKSLLKKHLKKADFWIMAAAVSDFVPEYQEGKIKKNAYSNGLNLYLQPNEDLLTKIPFKGKKIGFKMEVEKTNALQNAKNSLSQKKLDMVCLNILGQKNHFGSDENELYCITHTSSQKTGFKSKEKLGFELAKMCEKL
ncbi:bifunctional phosphopantothenoylcysteine decarboxylase/phosphopantothenate--cysteine ligase CoaBC [Campylobacter sp. MIT 21-1685]|uniref:bifunctional phosphopantothenoylcysteine decarboxylase/phosphopantothenate--cysteine ligase CoaBC n=1 Tax=unclassified Campylobacter TaxID=2593542 RepID=UPI00224B6B15|nr:MULTISPECIES: bifunctional phosphopantothenoylcysteine decarboxylase/phosphopantothenate--cysteine ligase CoaBC [unclassified Campylobacter]MCX2682777.1 bifunctional phosphopantothenoylcysteine decarboxylase/phosphopantothenate--cysteine ligase CoaBC [Campylobacter sp. MIT 21-1684]MCX2751077.1 bifunctional phosphopantothenoylcysteine decarboxylase/phosphopantothenate--cysteine ligase CoaBC [Campylobacter sp. MIT 21-1682]MCX2807258.1 bifunctional phosphopantothenoylcysteine decarboxylase/phosp